MVHWFLAISSIGTGKTDTAGQERFRTLTSSFYRNAKVIIFVYDITDRETFDNVEGHHIDSARYAKQSANFLVANKTDREKDRKVSKEEGESLANKLGVAFCEASAKDGTGIEELLRHVVDHYLKQ